MVYTLSMFNTGQITLPKKWRSQFKSNKYVARVQGKKLIIEPLEENLPEGLEDENVELYEDSENGEKISGIRFKKGLDKKAVEHLVNYLKNA